MATDRLTPDDADRMRDFADRCRRVHETALRVASAGDGEAEALMNRVANLAAELQSALLDAARFADPEGDDEDG